MVPPILEESAIATVVDRPTVPPRQRAARVPSRAPGVVVQWGTAALLLWLLVGPRIELPVLRGLRFEDVVFAVLATICLLHVRGLRRPTAPTAAVMGVVVTGLISAGVAAARGMVAPLDSVLFAVRPLEYWIAFPATLLLLRSAEVRWRQRLDQLLAVVTVLQTAFAVAQYYFGLPIGFSHAAYTRAAGLTVGPYELGAISAALLVYWVGYGRWTLASLASIALAASISRISILGAAAAVGVLAIGWLLLVLRRIKADGFRGAIRLPPSRLRIAGQVAAVAGAGVVLAFTLGLIHGPVPAPATVAGGQQQAAPAASPPLPAADTPARTTAPAPAAPPAGEGPPALKAPADSVAKRLATTSVSGNWVAADRIAASVPHPRNSAEYTFAAYAGLNLYLNVNTAANAGADMSNLVRFFRWHLILDTMDDPATVIFGLGPSYVGPSVDGSYLRMYADSGLLGVLAWVVLVTAWIRRTPLWMVCVTISMLVGALFIDILYAERPMALFWALLALALSRRREGRRERGPSMSRVPASAAPREVSRA